VIPFRAVHRSVAAIGAATVLLGGCAFLVSLDGLTGGPPPALLDSSIEASGSVHDDASGEPSETGDGAGVADDSGSDGGEVTPNANGYFVMSYGTWTGNLGGNVSAIHATCLSDLTAHTDWKGFADAHARGLLVAANVRAFICGTPHCTSLLPSRMYAFANAGNAAAGGATFTTDSSGGGPGDDADWSDAAHFGATTPYWSDRLYGTDTLWGLDTWSSTADCSTAAPWDTGTNAKSGGLGYPDQEGTGRWYPTSTVVGCATAAHLVCYVNP
jgi:hypothetical protein